MASHHQAQALARRLLKALESGSAKGSPRLITYAKSWLEQKKGTVARATFDFYQGQVAAIAATTLGKTPLAKITRQQISDWLNDRAKSRAASTANHSLKWLRMVLKCAEADELLARNPSSQVQCLRTEKTERRPFTLEELRRLIAAADSEWQSLIHFGLYTGQRLGDLASLTWAQIDLVQGEVRLRTRKTGRLQILPLAKPLLDHLLQSTAPDKGTAPVHPRAYKILMKQGRTGTISLQFYELMQAAGLMPPRGHGKKTGRQGKRRTTSTLSFHCLRHTATSLMKRAGVSPALVQEFIGHDSAEMNNHYTHLDTEALRIAADSLPKIPEMEEGQQLELLPLTNERTANGLTARKEHKP